MMTTEPMDREALLHRLAELERENRELRAQLQGKTPPVAPDPSPMIGASADDEDWPPHVSEKKLRQIADHLPALVAYVDADQRYRFNNRAYETWIGRTPESLYGLHLWDAVGIPAYERTRPYIEAVLAGERTGHEWWAPFRTGIRYVKSDYIPDRDENGRIIGFYVLASDLTETKRSQAALAESEARLRLAIDAGRMAVWEVGAATDSLTVSPELKRLLGLPRTQSCLRRTSGLAIIPANGSAFEPLPRRPSLVGTDMWRPSCGWSGLTAPCIGSCSGRRCRTSRTAYRREPWAWRSTLRR
jgi:PAS domain S-box-containing protein